MIKLGLKVLLLTLTLVSGVSGWLSRISGMPFQVCGVPLFLLGLAGAVWMILKFRYRPQENHVGVLYRLGRFQRFVLPNEWVFLNPILHSISHEISLFMQTAHIELTDVELADGLVVNTRFKVFFKVDPRQAAPENLLQLLRFHGSEWAGLIQTGIEDIVRNQVFLNMTYDELANSRKSRDIKRMLSQEIAARVKSFGILVHEERGVMLVEVHPNQTYREAVQTSRAAVPMGLATYERLRPVLEALKSLKSEDAHAALLLEIASKIIETSQLPEMYLTPTFEAPAGPLNGVAGGNGHRSLLDIPSVKGLPRAS